MTNIHAEAAAKVREQFPDNLCGPDKDTYFFVGTLAAYPTKWIVIGVFYPKKQRVTDKLNRGLPLFGREV